mgnify:CR=1 FL=1
MAETEKRPDESIDRALRRFKRSMKDEGILDDLRKREFYAKPSETRKEREKMAKIRNYKQQQEEW